MRIYPVVLPVLVVAQAASAKDGLAVSGSVRLRYEAIDGQARAGFNGSDDLVNVRTIATAEYRNGPWRLVGELWDSRAYGAHAGTPLTTGEVDALEPVQAFIGYDATLAHGGKLSVQTGRFLLNLGSRRLVAADEYRNTTNGFTGVRADLSLKGGAAATLFYALPQQRRPDDFASLDANRVALDREGFDQVLWGGLLSRKALFGQAMGEISFYHYGERDRFGRPTRDRSLNTLGTRIMREPAPGKWDWEGEGFIQRGTISASLAATAPMLEVDAWFAHASAGYSFASSWKPRLSLAFDIASGDRPGGRYGRFDTLFGMRRAELAPAGLYNAVGRANLLTPGVRVEATPSTAWDMFVSYRPLWLASRTDAFATTGVRDATGRSGRFAGHQFDARVRYWLIPKRLRLEADGVILAKGRFLRTAPNAPRDGDTHYVSLNATANF